MKLALALFWRRGWDNLGHLVLLNLLWFVLSVPFGISLKNAVVTLYPLETEAAQGSEEANFEGTRALEAGPVSSSDTSVGIQSTDDTLETGKRGKFQWSARGGMALVLLAMSWAVMCTATGFVYYAIADLVTEYDFSGYRFVTRNFLKRGPILKSLAALTFFTATLAASMANMAFYIAAAQAKGPVFLILAGVMLWFILFLSMTAALTLPVMAQRDLRAAYEKEAAPVAGDQGDAEAPGGGDSGLFKSVRTAAVIALSAPLGTFVVLVIAFLIVLAGVWTMAGMGFFAVAAPAALFNAYVFVQLGGTVRSSPELGAPSMYGTAN